MNNPYDVPGVLATVLAMKVEAYIHGYRLHLSEDALALIAEERRKVNADRKE